MNEARRKLLVVITGLLLGLIVCAWSGISHAQTFAKWNAADKCSGITVDSDGRAVLLAYIDNCGVRADLGRSTGKYYFELHVVTRALDPFVGIANLSADRSALHLGNAWVWQASGNFYKHGSAVSTGASYTSGDVLMFAYDADAGTLWIGKNGTWVTGNPAAGTFPLATGITGSVMPALMDYSPSWTASFQANFGQSAFTYVPPTGFLPGWCDGCEPDPPETPRGLWVCAALDEHGACGEFVELIDDVATWEDLDVTAGNITAALGLGAGLVFFFNIMGNIFGGVHSAVRTVFGGGHD